MAAGLAERLSCRGGAVSDVQQTTVGCTQARQLGLCQQAACGEHVTALLPVLCMSHLSLHVLHPIKAVIVPDCLAAVQGCSADMRCSLHTNNSLTSAALCLRQRLQQSPC
jgi:hypothetical protein